ncbi:hypothetical protein C5167_018860 [Papaver somniferum]|uniref:Uncharacterized protein n=1 Tax=Papaver somniferum TaxID=3469 RepID=A0A4Y7INH6_PAPSO|nr:hypothetical protein C5167_018860 [Papaver somniferum]
MTYNTRSQKHLSSVPVTFHSDLISQKHQEWSSSKDSDKQSEEVVSDYEDELTQEESEDSVDVNLASERTSSQLRCTSRQLRPIRNRSRTTEQSEDSGSENLAAQLTSRKLSPVRNQSHTTELEDSAESCHIQRHIPVQDVSVQPLQMERTKTVNLEDSSARQSENAKVTMTEEDYSAYLRDVSNSSLHADGRKQISLFNKESETKKTTMSSNEHL